MIDLQGKSALVTGGSRGIGRACCELLARAGARVAVNYQVETPSAESLVKSILEAAPRHPGSSGHEVSRLSQTRGAAPRQRYSAEP